MATKIPCLKNIKIPLFGILIGCLAACSGSEDKGKLLAKVYDEELYQSDLNYLFNEGGYSKADSIEIVENYVNRWVEEQILVHEANSIESMDQDAIDKKTEHFRNDLLIVELEEILINERLDTAVTDQEIQKFYEAHKQDFQLNDYLVNVLYLKIPEDAPDIEKINNSYKLRKASDIQEVDLYAKIYASNYYYEPEKWIYFDDLLKEIPLQDINKDRFIMNKSKTRFQENGFHYFLNIIDYKLKNSTSPLNFERENIKNRILNIRVKELRKEIRNEIIANAYKENSVTVY